MSTQVHAVAIRPWARIVWVALVVTSVSRHSMARLFPVSKCVGFIACCVVTRCAKWNLGLKATVTMRNYIYWASLWRSEWKTVRFSWSEISVCHSAVVHLDIQIAWKSVGVRESASTISALASRPTANGSHRSTVPRWCRSKSAQSIGVLLQWSNSTRLNQCLTEYLQYT